MYLRVSSVGFWISIDLEMLTFNNVQTNCASLVLSVVIFDIPC